jgi:ferredoxin-NADP reductase
LVAVLAGEVDRESPTGITPFMALVEQVMSTQPYASVSRVFWVVDNGSSRRDRAAAKRLNDALPNAEKTALTAKLGDQLSDTPRSR